MLDSCSAHHDSQERDMWNPYTISYWFRLQWNPVSAYSQIPYAAFLAHIRASSDEQSNGVPVQCSYIYVLLRDCKNNLYAPNRLSYSGITIIDLHDRSVIASITDRSITSDLAIRTLQKALDSQPNIKGDLILHSDQGSQFTSKAFVEFCESVHVTQSMSKAGYPYDNAPMERYFNTLKNECTNLYEFKTEEALYQTVEEFAYVEYNYVRPHSYNGYATPHEARGAV